MGKAGQLATKSKTNALQANKKKSLAKVPAAKQLSQARGGKKNVAAKLLIPPKNGNNSEDDDDDDDSDDDSMPDVAEDNEDSNDLDNSGDAEVDSESDDDEEDDDEEGEEEEVGDDDLPKKSGNNLLKHSDDAELGSDQEEDEEDDQEADEEENEEDDGSEDEAPEEKKIKKESKPAPSPKKVRKESENAAEPENAKSRKGVTVYVKRLSKDTTKDDIKKHFASCGKIVLIKLNPGARKTEAVVVFEDEAASHAALKLRNSVLKDTNILVVHGGVKQPFVDPNRTIILKNVGEQQNADAAELEKVLSKYGEIDVLSVVCEKNILAFITYKDVESLEKVKEVEGTTQNGIQLQFSSYQSKPPKTKVFVKNIARGTFEKHIREMFEAAGPIKAINVRENDKFTTAVITYENEEGYCRAFLLHEEKLRGRNILVEPFSEIRKPFNSKQKFSKPPFKHNKFAGKRPAGPPGPRKNGPPFKKQKNE